MADLTSTPKNLTLTVTERTTLAEVEAFASGVGADRQIRAKTNHDGETVLYSKKPGFSFGFKKGKRADKMALAMNAIQMQINKHVGVDTAAGSMLRNLVKGHPKPPDQLFLKGSDLKSILAKTATVATMAARTENIPTDQRPQLMVAMGQGAIGRLDELQFYSDSFSTCMPVVLFNRDTGIGGLFHMPAPQVDRRDESLTYRAGVRAALAEMIDLVRPTDIIVKPGAEAGVELAGTSMPGVPSVIQGARLVADDMARIAADKDIDSAVDFRSDQPSGFIVVTADGAGGLHVEDSDLAHGHEINLLRDGLPEEMADEALTWSLVEPGDDAVLVGSKF